MTRGRFVMQQRARQPELDHGEWNDRFGANWEEAMTGRLWPTAACWGWRRKAAL